MSDNTQVLTIFEPQNVQTLAQLAPRSYNENQLSHTRCLEAGRLLLEQIQREGMTDALDIEVAKFIEKAKITVKKMNSRRTPVTQLFDRIRRAYTTMENDVDPTKSASIPAQLQALRNAFAQKKHEQAEAARRAELARIAKENAKTRYRADVEGDYIRQFNALVNERVNELTGMDKQTCLENYETTLAGIKNYNCELPADWCQTVVSGVQHPAELSSEECTAIQTVILSSLSKRFSEQFPFEVEGTRDEILDRLPSKKTELERIAKASAEDAAKIKAQMEAKEREEALRKEAERIEREKQEAAEAKLSAEKHEMDSLFGTNVAVAAGYQPKTKIKKKAVVETADDIMAIVAFWWSQVGCSMSVEELAKEFKKQINFANAAANSKDNPMFISNVRYEDDVKAK